MLGFPSDPTGVNETAMRSPTVVLDGAVTVTRPRPSVPVTISDADSVAPAPLAATRIRRPAAGAPDSLRAKTVRVDSDAPSRWIVSVLSDVVSVSANSDGALMFGAEVFSMAHPERSSAAATEAAD